MSAARRGDLDGFIRRPDPKVRAILIHGSDRTSVRELGARVLAAATERPDDPFDVAKLSSSEIAAERLSAELSALSLMGGRRVVHARVVGDLGPRERLLAEALADHAGTGTPVSGALLLIEAGALDRRSVLRKTAEAAPNVLSLALYEEETVDLGRLAKEVLEREGLLAPAAILSSLAERLPRDRGSARRGLEALALYLGPGSHRTISELDLEAVLERDGESAALETALAAFSGRRAETAAALRRARFLGEAGPALIRQLSLHAAKLTKVRAGLASGAAAEAAVKSAGVFWKQEREVVGQLALWRSDVLDQVRRDLLAADMACKSAGSADELIAHQLALEIAYRAASAAVAR